MQRLNLFLLVVGLIVMGVLAVGNPTGNRAPMSISYNQKFLSTGTVYMHQAHISQSISSRAEIRMYAVPYPESLTNKNFLELLLSIDSIEHQIKTNVSEILAIQNVRETSFIMGIISGKFQNLTRMGVRYVILSGNYSSQNVNNMKVGVGFLEYFGMLNSSTTNLNGTLGFDIPLNISGGVTKGNCYLAGWGVESSTPEKLIDFSVKVYDWNSTTIIFQLYSNSTVNTYFGFALINFVVFNYDYYTMSSIGNFIDGNFFANFSTGSSKQYNNTHVYDFTTMVGLTGLHYQGSFQFNTSMTNGTGLTFTSPLTTDWVNMNHWLLMTFYCSYLTPYYYATDQYCYKVCPSRTFGDNVTLTCKSCPIDCLSCNAKKFCTSCDSTNDFRQLQEGYCVPIPGYYESNAKAAFPCPQKHCSDCTASQCFSCMSGYYKKGNTCFLIQDEVDGRQTSDAVSVTLLFVGLFVGLIVAYLLLLMYLKCKKQKKDQDFDGSQSEDMRPSLKEKGITQSHKALNEKGQSGTHMQRDLEDV